MHVAVIAAAGRGSVLVRPRPRVVVLSTGNELAEPGTPLVPGRIWDSNSFMLAAAAREAGALAYRQAILPDHPDEVLPAIEDQLVRADLLVTTGGVSMGGEHDVVKAALQQLGTMTFRKVAMQPGMPQGFGTIALPAAPVPAAGDRVPIFTLPGNPVSAYVSFQVFARPAIGAMQGYDGLGLERVQAALTGPLRSPPGRRSFLRGVLDRARGRVTPLPGWQSNPDYVVRLESTAAGHCKAYLDGELLVEQDLSPTGGPYVGFVSNWHRTNYGGAVDDGTNPGVSPRYEAVCIGMPPGSVG